MAPSNLLLDTSILIDYLRNHQPTVKFIDNLLLKSSSRIAISGISEFELYAGKSLDKPSEKKKVDFLLNQFIILPVLSLVLRKAGEIKRHYPVSAGDAIIAATALTAKFILLTKDPDFKKIPELKLLAI